MSQTLSTFRADRDAMGRMLLDYLENGYAIESVERDDGFLGAADHVNMYFAPYPEWAPIEQEGIARRVPGPTLDIGCGAGRVGLFLQEQGEAVTSIDVSPLAVEVCRRRGVRDARALSITGVSPALGRFANLIMFGNNWGLMGGFKRARWLLRRFHALTTPDARIIAVTNDVYQTDSPIHLAYHAWNRERGRMAGQLRLRVRYGIHTSPWFDYLMVSPEEMRQIVSGTGWRVREMIPSEGSNYTVILTKDV